MNHATFNEASSLLAFSSVNGVAVYQYWELDIRSLDFDILKFLLNAENFEANQISFLVQAS